MKARTRAGAFSDAVADASLGVDPKTTDATLINLRIEAKGNTIKIAGTNRIYYAAAVVQADVEVEGVTAVDHKRLKALCGHLPPSKNLSVTLDESHCVIKCGGAVYRFAALDPSAITEPARPGGTLVRHIGKRFSKAIALALQALPADATSNLYGVRFIIENGSCLIFATDTARLVAHRAKMKAGDVRMFIPGGGADALSKFAEPDACMAIDERRLFVWTDTRGFSIQLGEGREFPVEKILEGKTTRSAEADAPSMVGALDRLLAFRDGSDILFSFDAERVTLRVEDAVAGLAKESMKVVKSTEFSMKLNGKHIRQFLDSIGGVVRFAMSEGGNAVTVRGVEHAFPTAVFSTYAA